MGRKRGLQYRPGDFYRQDDLSGFTVRASQTRGMWNGLIVHEKSWEARNAQEFVRGIADDQTVPDPRPLSEDTFSGPTYTALTASSNPGSTTITLGTTSGLTNGDSIGIMLDSGIMFRTTINGTPTATVVTLAKALPSKASSGTLLVDY